jgi:DNA repair protein RadC
MKARLGRNTSVLHERRPLAAFLNLGSPTVSENATINSEARQRVPHHIPNRKPLSPEPQPSPSSVSGADAELKLLTGLLAYSQGSERAGALLRRFTSIGHVVSAEPQQLEDLGLTTGDVELLRLVKGAACLMAKAQVPERLTIGNWQALIEYLQTAMAYEQSEHLRILFLDGKNHLIADEVHQRGTVDHIPVYPREVVKRALLLNASALIVAHNHPSGDPTPSRDDIEMTGRLKEAAEALELRLHDHIVIGYTKHMSFRSAGLL